MAPGLVSSFANRNATSTNPSAMTNGKDVSNVTGINLQRSAKAPKSSSPRTPKTPKTPKTPVDKEGKASFWSRKRSTKKGSPTEKVPAEKAAAGGKGSAKERPTELQVRRGDSGAVESQQEDCFGVELSNWTSRDVAKTNSSGAKDKESAVDAPQSKARESQTEQADLEILEMPEAPPLRQTVEEDTLLGDRVDSPNESAGVEEIRAATMKQEVSPKKVVSEKAERDAGGKAEAGECPSLATAQSSENAHPASLEGALLEEGGNPFPNDADTLNPGGDIAAHAMDEQTKVRISMDTHLYSEEL